MDDEKYMYIYYMNDEKKPVTIQVSHKFTFDPDNPSKQPKIEHTILGPAQAELFKIEAPAGAIPFVKKWDKVVLLTYYLVK